MAMAFNSLGKVISGGAILFWGGYVYGEGAKG